jgi:ABC-type multidrug transport system ATPase subunit
MTVHLRAVKLSKRFGKRSYVFESVSFELQTGTITALVGGNGSGKSTLLRVITGTTRATSGRVLTSSPNMTIVPERFVPPRNMTPASYLEHMGRLRGEMTSTLRSRATYLLELLGVSYADRKNLGELSKGTAQKVVVAQAFMLPAPLIVLDEAHTGLDHRASDALNQLIREARTQRSAIIVCEHDQEHIPSVDQRLVLSGGKLESVPVNDALAVEPCALVRLLRTADTRGDCEALLGKTVVLASMTDSEVMLSVTRSAVNQLLGKALLDYWLVQEVRDQPHRDRLID